MIRRRRLQYPCRVEGWIQVCDREVRLGHKSRGSIQNSKVPLAPWEPYFCVLLQDEDTFTAYRSEEMAIGDSLFYELPRVRLDGGSRNFKRRWGYDLTTPPPPPLLEEEAEDDLYDLAETRSLRDDYFFLHSGQDTSYEKACGSDRRGSAPATPILGGRSIGHPEPTPSRLVSFFSKRSFKNNPLKRTKSVTKLERTKRSGGVYRVIGGVPGGMHDPLQSKLRSSKSEESLLSGHQRMMHTLDLRAGDVTIKPIHASILGQENCFQILSPSGTRYYSCRNAEERDKWVESLQKAVNPHIEHMRRTENSLKIFLHEAKGVTAKKKYFCELLLDNSLYARTSSKQKGDMCFWGEQFEFHGLPTVQNIRVDLYREAEKKRKKEKHVRVGSIDIPAKNVTSKSLIEKWYTISVENNKNSKDLPALRIKCKFQTTDILPIEMYSDFLQYLKSNYSILCELLEPVVSVKAKEDIATTMVHIMQKEGMARDFLTDLVIMEIHRIDDPTLLFRGNSLATKAMEAFMKLVGEKYLHETLRDVIKDIVAKGEDCEVDPNKVPHITYLPKQQENLKISVKRTWERISNSHPVFPLELRQCFCMYRERLAKMGKDHLSDNLISASIFLRFLCPAILSPSLFNITQEYPNLAVSRNLTLITKTLQTLANFTKFQGKESYMEFMNEFIETKQPEMRTFLRQISSRAGLDHRGVKFDGEIDIGCQLSVLHQLLCEALHKRTTHPNHICLPENQHHIDRLQRILDNISHKMNHPNVDIMQRLSTCYNNGIPNNTPLEQNKVSEDLHYATHSSLQKNIFLYNDPTTDGYQSRQNGHSNYQAVNGTQSESATTPRSSTLPRAYIIGSGRKPAADLHTSDDYVMLSAFEPDGRTKGPHPIVHSYSHSHLATTGPHNGVVTTPIHQNHHQHFHNHTSWNNGRPGIPQINGHRGNGHAMTHGEDRLDVSHDDHDRTSPGDHETNMKGSQTSISQLSNVASSGYQSFAYSQSSSPVDPVINNHDTNNNSNNNNTDHGHHLHGNNHSPNLHNSNHGSSAHISPLAFNNPMYHLHAASSPRAVPQRAQLSHFHPHNHHNQHQSPATSSLSSAHSVEEIPLRSSIGSTRGSRCTPQRAPSTSSEDSNSISCTPPQEHRYPPSFKKSAAPRTNPHCVPPNWGHTHTYTGLTPDHHHSTSDLLSSQCRRNKTTRRQSAEVNNGRRHQRPCHSDSSSEEEVTVQSRLRPTRLHSRVSDTKTLEEYEKEILQLRNAMDEMHMKLVAAEERVGVHPSTPESGVEAPIQHRSTSHLASPSTTTISSPSVTSNHLQSSQPYILEESNESIELLRKLLHDELKKKDAVIHAQEDHISNLNYTNTKLLHALHHCSDVNPDEEDGSNTSTTVKSASNETNQLSDTSDYKSSS